MRSVTTPSRARASPDMRRLRRVRARVRRPRGRSGTARQGRRPRRHSAAAPSNRAGRGAAVPHPRCRCRARSDPVQAAHAEGAEARRRVVQRAKTAELRGATRRGRAPTYARRRATGAGDEQRLASAATRTLRAHRSHPDDVDRGPHQRSGSAVRISGPDVRKRIVLLFGGGGRRGSVASAMDRCRTARTRTMR